MPLELSHNCRLANSSWRIEKARRMHLMLAQDNTAPQLMKGGHGAVRQPSLPILSMCEIWVEALLLAVGLSLHIMCMMLQIRERRSPIQSIVMMRGQRGQVLR